MWSTPQVWSTHCPSWLLIFCKEERHCSTAVKPPNCSWSDPGAGCWPQPPFLQCQTVVLGWPSSACARTLHNSTIAQNAALSCGCGWEHLPLFFYHAKPTNKYCLVRKVICFAHTQLQLCSKQMWLSSWCSWCCWLWVTTAQTRTLQPEKNNRPCYQTHAYRYGGFSCYRGAFTARFTKQINLQCKMFAANLIWKKNEE